MNKILVKLANLLYLNILILKYSFPFKKIILKLKILIIIILMRFWGMKNVFIQIIKKYFNFIRFFLHNLAFKVSFNMFLFKRNKIKTIIFLEQGAVVLGNHLKVEKKFSYKQLICCFVLFIFDESIMINIYDIVGIFFVQFFVHRDKWLFFFYP